MKKFGLKLVMKKMWESNKQKLLGLQIDRNLHFNEYVFLLCKKACKKLSVFARLSNFMSIKQKSFNGILY